MSRIISKVDTGPKSYRDNHASMTRKVEALRAMVQKARFERPDWTSPSKTDCR